MMWQEGKNSNAWKLTYRIEHAGDYGPRMMLKQQVDDSIRDKKARGEIATPYGPSGTDEAGEACFLATALRGWQTCIRATKTCMPPTNLASGWLAGLYSACKTELNTSPQAMHASLTPLTTQYCSVCVKQMA